MQTTTTARGPGAMVCTWLLWCGLLHDARSLSSPTARSCARGLCETREHLFISFRVGFCFEFRSYSVS
jgi:hypothetical protein